MKASDFFTLPESLAAFKQHFRSEAQPWEWVARIEAALAAFSFEGGARGAGPVPSGVRIEGPVFIHPTVKLPAYATVIGPAWIGPNTEIRPGAFIRNGVIVGAGCVLGNASEFKNCLLLDRVQAPHFNYVGDSVLGNGAHLGAGAVCSNLRLDRANVRVETPGGSIDSGLRKLGALIGDGGEVGCNAVLNPGALIGMRSLIMPSVAFSGYLPPESMFKARMSTTIIARRN